LGHAAIRDVFANELERVRQQYDMTILAWVVMPDHVHLVRVPPGGSLKREVARQIIARWVALDAAILRRITMADGRRWFWQAGGYDRVISGNELVER